METKNKASYPSVHADYDIYMCVCVEDGAHRKGAQGGILANTGSSRFSFSFPTGESITSMAREEEGLGAEDNEGVGKTFE
jgi:hypothetical protein